MAISIKHIAMRNSALKVTQLTQQLDNSNTTTLSNRNKPRKETNGPRDQQQAELDNGGTSDLHSVQRLSIKIY